MLPWNKRYCKSFVECQKPKDENMVHNETTVQIKSAPQKTKKTVFPETAEKIHIAAQNLENQGISASLLDIHTIKPLDNDLILKYAEKTKAIVTAEEHSIYGGLGSAVAELLAENMAVPMGRIGIRQFGESGAYEALLTKYEMDAVAVEHKVKEILCKKKV